jgi:hypothetical protein
MNHFHGLIQQHSREELLEQVIGMDSWADNVVVLLRQIDEALAGHPQHLRKVVAIRAAIKQAIKTR